MSVGNFEMPLPAVLYTNWLSNCYFLISCFRYLYLHCEESSCKCLCENVPLNLASPLGTSSRHHLWIYYGVLLNKDASFLLLFVFEWQMSKIPTRCFRWLILWSGLAGRAQDANSTILPGIQIMLLPMICPPPRWRAELGTDQIKKNVFYLCLRWEHTHLFLSIKMLENLQEDMEKHFW